MKVQFVAAENTSSNLSPSGAGVFCAREQNVCVHNEKLFICFNFAPLKSFFPSVVSLFLLRRICVIIRVL